MIFNLKNVILSLAVLLCLNDLLFAQKKFSDDILKKDSLYTPGRTSPFNMGTKDKYGEKYSSQSSGTNGTEKNCLKFNFGLLGRCVIAAEYEYLFSDSWTFQGGLGTTLFRDFTNELWLADEDFYSIETPVKNNYGLHLSGQLRYHFDDVFDDYFLSFGTRYTGYKLQYESGTYYRTRAFTEQNLDFIGGMGWGVSGLGGAYFEFEMGGGYRKINTYNVEYVGTSNYTNYTTTNPEVTILPKQYFRPMLFISMKVGGIF